MAINRKYLQRVEKRDTRQETKNQTNAEKKNSQKFNTGINLDAVFGAITQLLETFTSQVLDRNSVNMSLLLRTIYRNLDNDLVDILSEPQNVEYLNKQLEEKNKEVAKALAAASTTTETPTGKPQAQPTQQTAPAEQVPVASEHLTTTITNVERVRDKVIEKSPEVIVAPPEVIGKSVAVERTETLPDVIEEEQVTERTETLPEEVTESRSETSEVRIIPSTPDVSQTQRAFAAGEITSDADIDILELAQDFINELATDAWNIRQSTGAMAQGLTDRYTEFTDKIDEDDEDEYEWNLYRYMFRKQQEMEEAKKAKMTEVLAKRAKAMSSIVKATEGPAVEEAEEQPPNVEPKAEEPKEIAPSEEPQKQEAAVQPSGRTESPSKLPEHQSAKIPEKVIVIEKVVEVEKAVEKGVAIEQPEEKKEEEKPEEKQQTPKAPSEKDEQPEQPTQQQEQKSVEGAKQEQPKAEEPKVVLEEPKAADDKKKKEKKKDKPKKGIFQTLMDRFKASVKRRKEALLKKILPPLPTLGETEESEEGKQEEGMQEEAPKKGGLLSAILRPFSVRKERQAALKDIFLAAKDKQSKVFLAPIPLRKTILSRLKDGKQLMKLWGRRNVLLMQPTQQVDGVGAKKPAKGLWVGLFTKKAQSAKPGQPQTAKPPQQTMFGRGVLRAANTAKTIRNVFFKPKVHHIAVMNNAVVYPLWIKKIKEKQKDKRKLGVLGRMKRALFGDPAIKWKPLALGWRKFSLAQDKSLRQVLKNRAAWQKNSYRWQWLYYRLLKQFQKERAAKRKKPDKKVSKMVATASKALIATGKLADKSVVRPDVITAMDIKNREDRAGEKKDQHEPEQKPQQEKQSAVQQEAPAKDIAPKSMPAPTARLIEIAQSLAPKPAEVEAKAEKAAAVAETPKPSVATQQEEPQQTHRPNVLVRLAKRAVKTAGAAFGAKAPQAEVQTQPSPSPPPQKVSLVKETPALAPTPPPATPKTIPPVIKKAVAAKGSSAKQAPSAGAKALPNPSLTTPKPVAQKPAKAPKKRANAITKFAKGMVAIPGKMIDKARSLRKQQQKDQKEASAQQGSARGAAPEKPKFGLGLLSRRSKMSDDEAFRRNVNEESAKVHSALDDKSIERMGFPHKKIANALKRFFGSTSQIAKKANKDLNDVEDAINNPKRGLWSTIKSFIFKVLIGGLLTIGILTWFRSAVGSWMPRDKAGKMFHGPVIFGVQLPSFKDLLLQGRALFYMIWTPLKTMVRTVTRGVKKFMKNNEINSFGGFLKYIGYFLAGYFFGKIMAGADGGMGDMVKSGGKITQAAGMLPKFLGFLKGPLLKIADMIPIMATIKMAIRLASMVGGALWCLITDIFGGSNKASDELIDDAAKYGEAKVMELVGENRHGKAAGKVLIHKAKKIKPLVPVQNLLPESMTTKDARGKLKIKALVPNLPTVNLGSGTITDEMDDINDVADKRRESKMEDAKNSGITEINKAIEGMPEPGNDPAIMSAAGDMSARKKASLKFIALADKNIAMLQKAHDEVGDDFDGPFWSIDWLDDEGDNPKRAWNPQWQYTGANAKMLKTKMPLTPFEDNSDGSKEYDLAVPWDHEIMGILPLGVRIPQTNGAYIVDVPSWQKWRYSVGIRNWTRVRDWVEDNPEDFGTEDFQERVADQAQDWVDYTLEPGVWARIRDGRKSGMVDRWNEWNEDYGNVKEKVAEIREGIQATPKPKPDKGSEKGGGKPKPSGWSNFWSKAKNAVKNVAKYGTGIGLAVLAGKKVWSLFRRDEAEKKPPPPPPPPPPWGLIYIRRELYRRPWRLLNSKDAKDEDLRRMFHVDKWFDKVPASDEKLYKKGIGKMFYNILMAMGFKYDKAVWQNPQFLKVRAQSMKAMVDAINGYINDIIRPHGAYMNALFEWAKTHKSIEEQDAVKKAAMKESEDIWKAINKDNFMEYVARFYVPTDIHLVVRNKHGKIIKEEGQELKGWAVPKELYDQDPKYWDYVMSLMNESALPPESLLKLHQTRMELMFAIDKGTKRISEYMDRLRAKKKRLEFANMFADDMLAYRMRLLTRTTSNVRFRVELAKKEIKLYFKYRKFLDTGSLGAFRSFVMGGNKLSKKEQTMLFGEQIEGGTKSLSERMLGSVSDVIADRSRLIKRMRAILKKVLNNGESAIHEQKRSTFTFLKTVVKTAGKKVVEVAKGATKEVKGFVLGQVKEGIKMGKALKKATSTNLNLFSLFTKKKADENDVNIQVEAAAKEMVPPEDKDGKERLKSIVKMSQDRKAAAEKEKSGLKNYWENLRRQWKDRISEESMKELKTASSRLSENIFDYLGMVREIPAGNTTIVTTTINQMPSVVELMPEITF